MLGTGSAPWRDLAGQAMDGSAYPARNLDGLFSLGVP